MAAGDIGAIIDTLEFDDVYSYYPDIIHVSGDVYAIAYQGADSDGWLKTVTIESNGQIGAAAIDSFEFDGVSGNYPVIIHVSDDVYAIAYLAPDFDGWLKTVTIASDGQIGAAAIDSLEFDATGCNYPDIIHVSGDVFAIAYTGGGGDGWLKTVTIASDGQIGAAAIDSLEFDADRGQRVSIIHVAGNVYAIAYLGTDFDGFLITVTIESDGQIGAGAIDSLEFDAAGCDHPDIIHISGDVYAIAYQNVGSGGSLKTVTIESNGQIGAAVIDSLIFDAAGCIFPDIVHVAGDVYAITYQGADLDGWLKTVTIASDGQIGAGAIDSFEFDELDGTSPAIIHISGDVFAIAYRGVDADGFLITVDISTVLPGGPKHLMILGVG